MRTIFVYALVFMCIAACTRSNYEITTTDEVKTIINKEMPIQVYEFEPDVLFREDLSQFTISQISSILEDKDGNVYVLDYEEANIKKFDHNGNYLKTLCHKGQGPEELNYPILFRINNRDELVVYDSGQNILKTLDLDGNYISSHKVESFLINDFCIGDDNTIFCVGSNWSTENSKMDIYPFSESYEHLAAFSPTLSKEESPMKSVALSMYNKDFFINFLTENLIVKVVDKKPSLVIKRHVYVEGGTKEISLGGKNVYYQRNYTAFHNEVDSKGNVYIIAPRFPLGEEHDDSEIEYVLQIFTNNGVQIANIGIIDMDIDSFTIINDYLYAYSNENSCLIRYKPVKI